MSSPLQYCRFCAEQKPEYSLKNVHVEIESRKIMEKLPLFSDLLIDLLVDLNNKTLPDTVCGGCLDAMESCYEFLVKVKRSQEALSAISIDNKKEVEIIKFEEAEVDERVDSPVDDSGYNFKEDSYSSCSDSIKVTSWSSYPWQCAHCDTSLCSLEELREHSRTAHSTCLSYKCADCDHTPTSFQEFVHHVREHWECLKKYCEYCNMKMEDKTHTEMHLNKHNCTFCGEIFEEETLLLLHLTLYMSKPTGLLAFGTEICDGTMDDIENGPVNNWSDYPSVCQYCGLKFIDRDILNEHCMNVHGTCFGLRCVDCSETQNTFMDFVVHVHGHKPQLIPICPYCETDMGGFYDELHIHKHKDDGHICVLCGEIFTSKRSLRRHEAKLSPSPLIKPPVRRKQKKEPLTDKDLTCDVCGRVMKTILSLKAHRIRHSERNKNFTCEHCGKSFYTKGSLVSHNDIHNTSFEVCKICNKSFKTLNRLRKHVKTHNLEKPFQCDNCKRFFSSKDRLREHMKSHMNIMPYMCSYCNKRFRHKSILNTHINQHTGARPYSCDSCSMDFTNWSNCNKHMKRKHGTTLAKNVMTPHGKLALNPHTGKPEELALNNVSKEWSQRVLLVTRKPRNQ